MKDYFQGETLDLYSGDSRAERASLRERAMTWLVRAGIVLLLAVIFWPWEAMAQDLPLHVHEGEAATVKLMPGTCADPTSRMLIASLPPELQALKWRHIDSRWRMQDGGYRDFPGCWADVGDSFLVVFSDATGGMVKKSEFRKVKGQTGI